MCTSTVARVLSNEIKKCFHQASRVTFFGENSKIIQDHSRDHTAESGFVAGVVLKRALYTSTVPCPPFAVVDCSA